MGRVCGQFIIALFPKALFCPCNAPCWSLIGAVTRYSVQKMVLDGNHHRRLRLSSSCCSDKTGSGLNHIRPQLGFCMTECLHTNRHNNCCMQKMRRQATRTFCSFQHLVYRQKISFQCVRVRGLACIKEAPKLMTAFCPLTLLHVPLPRLPTPPLLCP